MTGKWEESVCKDCGIPGGIKEGQMCVFYIHDQLWNSIADTHDILCFDCTEKRLGRHIVRDDLKDCSLTRYIDLAMRIYIHTEEAKRR